jgi:hypothetical protein
MNKDSPDGSPYGTLAKHDQSETKRDTRAKVKVVSHMTDCNSTRDK